jgi:NADH-quinone oxidoreductase subunit K
MFLCAELMLQGVSVTLVGFSAYHANWSGQVFAIFSLALAAAEAGIALALFVVLFRRGHSLDISLWQDLREADLPSIPDDVAPVERAPEPRWPRLTPAGVLPADRGAALENGKLPRQRREPVSASNRAGGRDG